MGSLMSRPKPPVAPKPLKLPAYVPPPAPEPVTQAPSAVTDQAAIAERNRLERLRKSEMSGRASTFLSDDEGALG